MAAKAHIVQLHTDLNEKANEKKGESQEKKVSSTKDNKVKHEAYEAKGCNARVK